MDKKLVCLIALVVVALSVQVTLPSFNNYNGNSNNNVIEKQMFNDANGVRCLMSDTIAGDKCPYDTTGVNLKTGKYYTGASPMAKLNQEIYGLDDPYEQIPINKRP